MEQQDPYVSWLKREFSRRYGVTTKDDFDGHYDIPRERQRDKEMKNEQSYWE